MRGWLSLGGHMSAGLVVIVSAGLVVIGWAHECGVGCHWVGT